MTKLRCFESWKLATCSRYQKLSHTNSTAFKTAQTPQLISGKFIVYVLKLEFFKVNMKFHYFVTMSSLITSQGSVCTRVG